MTNVLTYDRVIVDGRELRGRTPVMLDEERNWPVRDSIDEAWLDAIALGRGFCQAPCEILASRDPGRVSMREVG